MLHHVCGEDYSQTAVKATTERDVRLVLCVIIIRFYIQLCVTERSQYYLTPFILLAKQRYIRVGKMDTQGRAFCCAWTISECNKDWKESQLKYLNRVFVNVKQECYEAKIISIGK